jgi:hypothetical protein
MITRLSRAFRSWLVTCSERVTVWRCRIATEPTSASACAIFRSVGSRCRVSAEQVQRADRRGRGVQRGGVHGPVAFSLGVAGEIGPALRVSGEVGDRDGFTTLDAFQTGSALALQLEQLQA